MRADTTGLNVDFFTVVISVEETTEEIIAYHFQSRVPADGDNESSWRNSTMKPVISQYTHRISLLLTLVLGFALDSYNNKDILLVL